MAAQGGVQGHASNVGALILPLEMPAAMSFTTSSTTDRVRAGAAAVIVQVAFGYALIAGFAVNFPKIMPEAMMLFAASPPPPPPAIKPVVPPRKALFRPQGAASPPNLRAIATPVVAPVPVVAVPLPPNMVVTPQADEGRAVASGAAPVAGPGTGSGGQGDGSGSGGVGDGDGGGGAPLRKTGGRITGRDYPRGPYEAGIGGTLFVRYTVGVRGRVTDCAVTRSSGNAELDAATCRLIAERFRFKPRRNSAGKPVPAVIVEDHSWVVDRPEPVELDTE